MNFSIRKKWAILLKIFIVQLIKAGNCLYQHPLFNTEMSQMMKIIEILITIINLNFSIAGTIAVFFSFLRP